MKKLARTVFWAVTLWSGVSSASPWTKSTGEAYLKVGEGLFLSNSYVDSTGKLQTGVSYFGASTFAYFEVGLFEQLHVMGYLPYTISINSFQDGWQFMRGGGGDAMVGLQWSPKLAIPAALRLDFKVPMYDVARFAAFGAESTRFPSLGDGQVDATLWVSVGGAVPDTDLYLFGEAGYRLRTEIYVGKGWLVPIEYADSVSAVIQAGYRLFDSLILAATGTLLMPTAFDEYTRGFLSVGLSAYYPVFEGLAVEASFDPIVWARNAARGYGMSLGVSYSL